MVGRPARLAASPTAAPRDPTGLSWRWPRLSDADRTAMASLCRAPGDSFQGAENVPQQCDIAQPTNPFDTYNACITAAVSGSDTPTEGQAFAGVPAGNKCNFAADGPEAEKPPFDRCPGQSCQDKYDPCPNQSCEGKSEDKQPASAGETKTATAGSTKTGTPPPDPNDRRAQAEATIRAARADPTNRQKLEQALKAQDEIDEMDRVAKVSRDIQKLFRDAGTSTSGFPTPGLDELLRLQKGSGGRQFCTDPGGCSDTCTDIGRQLASANACTQGLLNAIGTALGRPSKGNLPNKRPLGPVEHPRPDAPTIADTSSDVCLLGDSSPTLPNLACGVELCTDGFLSISGSDSCHCRAGATPWKPLVNGCLFTIRCQQSASTPDQSCNCKPAGATEVLGVSPRPLPEWIGLRSTATLPAGAWTIRDIPVGGPSTTPPGR
jgi:hypothetical protein